MVECDSDPDIIVTIGLCAMERKVTSKPMKEILRRMDKFQHIRVIIFDEGMILNDPVDTWPICDALVSFYSEGFPLEKAIEYSELRNPYLVNDLESQYILMNRKLVYECLKREGVPVPRSVSVIRDGISPTPNVIESDDSIEIDGKVFHKPFVEKPINAEDHNVYIYFPSSAGGGSQRLFRKVGNLSSRYYPDSNIRTTGSFIYEDFLPTDGTDVKVYTVADDYAHAEARKSPALDGVVERDYEGKEVRYPVILTPREKNIAKKVANAVKQQICGFDLLRANGMSYVCDVNGFSFVKSSRKYYDDCSHILGVLITRKTAPRLCLPAYLPPGTDVDTPLVPTTCGTIMELRCVIAVIRHGDRTPKQKMKMEVRHERFFALFSKYASGLWIHELKLKRPTQLQEVLEIVRCILHEMETGECDDPQLLENKNKFEQLRYVLEMYGSFSGINRKIQLKYYAHGLPKNTKVKAADTLSSSASGGLNANETQPSLLLVVKWGGELTPAGRQQAENLGRAFRCIYPGGDGHYGKDPGLGLLRLHSTYRHDLKIYASDEGRVQMTAAAFAKGFLALEGELPPILVQMVKSANTNGLLDNDHDCRHYQNTVKHKLREVMSKREDFNEEDLAVLVPTGSVSMVEAMRYVNNPREACNRLFEHVRRLHEHLKLMATSLERLQAVQLYQGESWDLLLRRWGKLLKDFKPREGDYDLTKISDIYDNIKFDLQHNPGILVASEQHDFFMCAKSLADIVVPQEYGITKEEKLAIGQRICTPLMRKILSDARYTGVDECTRLHAGYSKGVASPERFVRSRLYFTSESHLHSLLTCLRYGGLADVTTDEQWRRAMDYVSTISEINYLAQIVIMIYEDPSVRLNSQVSVLSSGTSVGKCSTESLTQYSTRVGTHGSVTPLTYAPPRQKGRSVNVCEICSQQAKEQMPLPDDQLVSKSPDPSSNISLLTDPGVISSTSHSSLNNLDLNSSVSVALPPDCNNVADKLNNLRIWQAAVAAGAEPGGRMVSAIDKSGETSASTTSPNNELAAATDNNLSKKLDLKASLVTNGHAPCIEQEPNQQKTPPPLSTPEVTLQGSSGTRIGTPGRPKSMPFDTIYTKIPSDTSITSSFSLAPAPPDTPEVRATQSMPTPSSSCSNTAAAEEKKVSIGRFLITRSVTDQQESSKQQNPTATTAAKTQHTTSGTPAAATKAAEVNLPNCGTMPTSLSSTSSLTSKSQTLAPTRIMLCHVGRQATSCPPDRGHTGGVLVSADRQLTRSNTLDSSDRREYQARQQQQQQQEQQRSVTSGGGRQRQAPTASTSPSPARQSQSVGGKPPKIAVKRVACGTLLPKAVNTGQPPQRQQADNRRPEETLAEGVQSAGKATDGLVEQQPQMKLSLVQSQGSTEKTSFQGNDAVTSKLEDQEVLTPTANLQLQDQLQLAYHRMHQHNLMRRHSTGSLMLPHHQLANPNTGTLHSAGVSVSALPACSLGHFLGFLVDPCPLSATQTTTTAQPDELCPGPPQRVPQLPRKRVGRVKVEPLTTGHSLPARGELAEESVVDPRRPELTMGQRSGTLEVADEEEDDEQSTANNQTLNALTFPSSFSPYHIEFNRLVRLSNDDSVEATVAMGIPFPKPFCRSLISTAVIRGSRDDTQASSSVPDIKHLMEDPDQPPRTLTPGTSTDFPVPSAPSVPEVYPLETLHNALTLNQLETFFAKITTHKFDTPFTSPQHPSTPISFYPPLACSHLNNAPIYGSATSLPTTINDQNVSDELLFFSTPPNQCDLPYSLDAQEQDLNQQPQQYTGSLLRIYSADNMATMNTTIPSLKTAAQPSSSTTDGFAEVTSETVTDYGCWLKHTEPE